MPRHISGSQFSNQECQRRDWARHKAECRTQVLKLARVEGRGVSVIATRSIGSGTKIFEVQIYFDKYFLHQVYYLGRAYIVDKDTK